MGKVGRERLERGREALGEGERAGGRVVRRKLGYQET